MNSKDSQANNTLSKTSSKISELEKQLRKSIDANEFDEIRDLLPTNISFQEYSKVLDRFIKTIEKNGTDEGLLKIKEMLKKEKIKITPVRNLNSILPKNFYITNSKVARNIPKDFPIDKDVLIAIGKKGSKKEITTYVKLNYENKNLSFTSVLDSYDKIVHDAVCTLHLAGNTTFTPEMVYRAMNGMTETEYVSPQSVQEIITSIEKSRFTKLTIDFTEEAKIKNLKADKTTLSNMLLAVTEVDVVVSGITKKAYFLDREPILYTYSNAVGQIINIPIKLLETKEIIRSTKEVVILKEYLIERIEGMKNKKNNLQSNNILYESVYKKLSLNKPTKQKASKLRNCIKKILENWVTEKYIKCFKEYKDGGKFNGITVDIT